VDCCGGRGSDGLGHGSGHTFGSIEGTDDFALLVQLIRYLEAPVVNLPVANRAALLQRSCAEMDGQGSA
jgi:hypothetical protein